MPIQLYTEDVLAHIGGPDTFAAQASAIKGCVTVIALGPAYVEVCWQLSGDEIKVTAEIKTPLGDVDLGKCDLTREHASCTIGGHIDGFKAEVTLTGDFDAKTLTLEGTVCAPFAGCAKGSVTIHF